MTFLLRINFSALGVPETEPVLTANSWTLYARCTARKPDTCQLFDQIRSMVPKDQRAALSALHKLVQVAASGEPITNFYNKKQCHEIHSFNYKGRHRTIWRIWKGDVIRVTFYYGDNRAIFLTGAFAKYEDKLTTTQKMILEKEAIAYIDAKDSGTLQFF